MFSDPRYSDRSTDIIRKLSESTANIKDYDSIQLGRAVNMINTRGRIEVYFVIDLSESMKDKHIQNLIDFSKGLVKRVSHHQLLTVFIVGLWATGVASLITTVYVIF